MGKYEEALERAKEIYNAPVATIVTRTFLEQIFPELKESKDERIRKAIGVAICGTKATSILEANGSTLPEALDYLERQKEQKPTAEEVLIKAGLKPFKDGNQWCVLVGDNIQEGVCGFGDTIEDALYDFLISVLDLQKEQKPAEWNRQSIIDALTKWLTEKIAPLHKKSLDGTITEKEEMFEAALLEMRSLVNSPDFQIEKDTSAEWSEEDERMLNVAIRSCVQTIEDYPNDKVRFNDCIAWLKSLRPAKDCSSCAQNLKGYISGRSDAENKLLEQFGALVTPENELHIKPRWKPSEEQMEALMLAIEGKCPPTSYMSRRLEELYEVLANTYKVECKLEN